MSEKELPLSGYAILGVHTTHQELRHKPVSDEAAASNVLRFGWDWRRIDKWIFEVRISVAVEPSAARPEYIETNVLGRFSQVDDSPNVPLDRFVTLQAVAILLPYARQFLSSLTMSSLHGPYFLHTINVESLMKDFDPSNATGASQSVGKEGGLRPVRKTRVAGHRPAKRAGQAGRPKPRRRAE